MQIGSNRCCELGAITVALVALCTCSDTIASGEDFKVLMIGNSYVQGNATAPDVSLVLQGLFNADPHHSAMINKYAIGGGSLSGRVNDSLVTGPGGLLTDPNYAWDVIILQERSLRPGLAMKYGGSELAALDSGGPVLINDYIKVIQPQAEVLLYNTWARELDNQDLIDDFNNNPNEMLYYTNQGYDRIRENPGFWDHSDITSIARVGDAWNQWYNKYGYADNSIDLHEPDGTHQNERGSYLAAAVLFETITGTSTVGNPYAGFVSGTYEGELIVSLLQQQATDVTGVGVNADFDEDNDVDGLDFLAWQRGFGLSETAQHADGDANGDGSVNGEDLAIWESQYAAQASSSLAVVPEPSSLALVAVLLLSNLRFQRQNRTWGFQ